MTAYVTHMRECSDGYCPAGCTHLCWECSDCGHSGGFGATRETVAALASEHNQIQHPASVPPANGRPATVAEMLEKVASLLDAGEVAFQELARVRGDESYLSGSKAVQQDLRALAAGLSADSELDAEVMKILTSGGR